MSDYKRLRELAEAATPGPWRNGADRCHFDSPEVTGDKTFSYYVPTDKDAAFIASASPSTVLALLDELNHSKRFLAAEIAVNDRHRETNRKALDLLGIKYPGLCNEYVWGGGIVEGVEALQRDLAALRGALVDVHELAAEGWAYAGDYFREKWQADARLAELANLAHGGDAK